MTTLTERLEGLSPDDVLQLLAKDVAAGQAAETRASIEGLDKEEQHPLLVLLAEACARADQQEEALLCVDTLLPQLDQERQLDLQMYRCDLLTRFDRQQEAATNLKKLADALHQKKRGLAAAQCLRLLSDVHLKASEFDKALAINGLAYRRLGTKSDHPLSAVLAAQEGALLSVTGKTKEALQAFERAIDRLEETGHPDEGWAIDVVEAAGIVCLLQQPPALDRAEELLNQTLSRVSRTYGLDHVRTAATMKHLATLCLLQGESKEAQRLAERAAAIEGRSNARTYHLLAATYAANGDKEAALTAIAGGLALDGGKVINRALSSLEAQLSSV